MSTKGKSTKEPKYTVTKIWRKRVVAGQNMYYVKWHGTDGSRGTTWEPEDNLVSADPKRCEIKLFNRLWDAHQKKMERKRKAALSKNMERHPCSSKLSKPVVKSEPSETATSASFIKVEPVQCVVEEKKGRTTKNSQKAQTKPSPLIHKMEPKPELDFSIH